jgi:hypothetical protein
MQVLDDRSDIHCRPIESARADSARRWSDLKFLLIELIVASIIAIPLFWLNKRNLLSYIDGQYLLTLIDSQQLFGTRLPVFSGNPLQGLGDVWYFANPSWIPEFLAARLFDARSVRVVAIHSVAFIEVFLAVTLLSYWLDSAMGKAVASGWLAGLIMFPLAFPSLIYGVSSDAPQIAFLTSVPIAMVPLLFSIGRNSALRDAVASCAIVLLMWIHFLALGLFVVLTYPFLLVVGAAFLIQSVGDRVTFRKKMIWSTFIVAILFATGLPEILFAFVTDTAFQFFPAELARDTHTLDDGSIILRTSEPIGILVATGGLVGAISCAAFGSGRTRSFGAATSTLAACILIASLIYKAVGFGGAKPIYYEYVLWPIYPIFLVSILSSLWSRFERHLPTAPNRPKLVAQRTAWIALPLLAVIVLHGPNYVAGVDNDRPNVYPPTPSAISESLQQSIGLVPGRKFNGRVATITGAEFSPGTTWDDAFRYDLSLIRSIGNEHRTIGLWFYNIPTLIEFSHAIRPLLFAVTKTFLAREQDGQRLNILNFRTANTRVLRLLGVRYLVTDRSLPVEGTSRILAIPVPGQIHPLALDELANPNIGVSPTTPIVERGRQAMPRLSDGDFDFETAAIVTDEIKTPLTRAAEIGISVEPGGLRVRASSEGESLVVIPFQYSHCLRAFSRQSGEELTLIRADFLLTGVLFHGTLDADIEYRQGPFVGGLCGLSDLREDRQALSQREP